MNCVSEPVLSFKKGASMKTQHGPYSFYYFSYQPRDGDPSVEADVRIAPSDTVAIVLMELRASGIEPIEIEEAPVDSLPAASRWMANVMIAVSSGAPENVHEEFLGRHDQKLFEMARKAQ